MSKKICNIHRKMFISAAGILWMITTSSACGSLQISDTSDISAPALSEEFSSSISEEEPHLLAFGKVLWDVYQKGILPDGHELCYTDMESAENNSFAIIDIDGDGKEELLLFWEAAGMAGMVEYVFGYDNGAIYTELAAFPAMTFYDNGAVKAEWSHNQGLAGAFWPYTVYCYDVENDVYQSFGGVDAWDRSYYKESDTGQAFPVEIDADGDGIIYHILSADGDRQDAMLWVDGEAYENWRDSYFDGAKEMNISTQKLTEENIAILGYPKPNVLIPQPVG